MTCVAVAITLLIYSIDWDREIVMAAGYMLVFAFFTMFLLQMTLLVFWALFRPLKLIHSRRRYMRMNPFARLFVHEAGWRMAIGFGRFLGVIVLTLCFGMWAFLLSLALKGLKVE